MIRSLFAYGLPGRSRCRSLLGCCCGHLRVPRTRAANGPYSSRSWITRGIVLLQRRCSPGAVGAGCLLSARQALRGEGTLGVALAECVTSYDCKPPQSRRRRESLPAGYGAGLAFLLGVCALLLRTGLYQSNSLSTSTHWWMRPSSTTLSYMAPPRD